ERQVRARIRIQQDQPVGPVPAAGLDRWAGLNQSSGLNQWKDRVPDFFEFPLAAKCASRSQRAQQLRTAGVAQILAERLIQPAARTVDNVTPLSLNRVESQKSTQLAQRLARTPGQIEPSRIGAIDDIGVVIAWNK